jgi:hypothetical protein
MCLELLCVDLCQTVQQSGARDEGVPGLVNRPVPRAIPSCERVTKASRSSYSLRVNPVGSVGHPVRAEYFILDDFCSLYVRMEF